MPVDCTVGGTGGAGDTSYSSPKDSTSTPADCNPRGTGGAGDTLIHHLMIEMLLSRENHLHVSHHLDRGLICDVNVETGSQFKLNYGWRL